VPENLTIGEYLCGILPRLQADLKFPDWPPDCFALCLALLKRTGAYSELLQTWPPKQPNQTSQLALDQWTSRIRGLGEKWRESWNQKPFDDLSEDWALLCRSFEVRLNKVGEDRTLSLSVLTLACTADEASEGVGAPKDDQWDEFLDDASVLLSNFGTLCREIDDSRMRVLPRMHTPQNGLTERSLSLYLSLCSPCEVTPQWLLTPFVQSDSINLLTIPWPFEVLVKQFHDVTDSAGTTLPERFGFFEYEVAGVDKELVGVVMALFREAKRKLGRIDGIIMPELAITDQQFQLLREKLPAQCFLVSGVGSASKRGLRGGNKVRLSFPPLEDLIQRKHHPWKLNESQVVQYNLGGVLSPSRDWWEYADFTDRTLSFISMNADLVLSVLVCEDLARPDPVADIVRAIGPNLVIALLMDGPQTKERWAARYATVLADDPGCSVLSFTSLGMARLSRPKSGPSRSPVVALWKDYLSGPTEIELDPGHDAVALSLSIKFEEEYTADGRGDDFSAAFPILSGVHPIRDPRPGRKV
jgi:hypothetical protein